MLVLLYIICIQHLFDFYCEMWYHFFCPLVCLLCSIFVHLWFSNTGFISFKFCWFYEIFLLHVPKSFKRLKVHRKWNILVKYISIDNFGNHSIQWHKFSAWHYLHQYMAIFTSIQLTIETFLSCEMKKGLSKLLGCLLAVLCFVCLFVCFLFCFVYWFVFYFRLNTLPSMNVSLTT